MPDLATCTPDAAGTDITCVLSTANFQNGDPVTADDVAFTYRLANANTGVESEFGRPCIASLLPIRSSCLFEILDRVDRVDDHTVAFHLDRGYIGFPYLVSALTYNAAILPKGYKVGQFIKGGIGTGASVVA